MRTLTYYVGVSLDGFIAAPDGSYDFYPLGDDLVAHMAAEYPDLLPTPFRAAAGVDTPVTRFDTVVMGRATYDPALKEGVADPYAHLRTYVVTRSLGESPAPNVTLIASDPLAAVRELKRQEGLGIYLAGGARLAGALLPEIDELVIKTYPIVLGSGIPMFSAEFGVESFRRTSGRAFGGGAMITTYVRERESG
ncbi:dihydrofolate reductase family protein [Streptomyces sp. NPDC047108]|uniref:dihydrofolate reductase family protein n=1 Tax=Streptomyces sp. NPDC047108 TaxID=3155025 RepID=UPI0033F9AE17